MGTPHHLSWDNFRSTVFVHGQQRVHRVFGSPSIEIFGDGVVNRLGIWIETPPGTVVPSDLSKFTFITTQIVQQNRHTRLEIATSVPSLYRQFYHFAVAVSERVVVEHKSPIDAAL